MAKISTMAAALVIGATSAIVPALPAWAGSVTDFNVCGVTCSGGTQGTITWSNGTAVITGAVWDSGIGKTTALFQAYAGDTRVDTESVAANDRGDLGAWREFQFTVAATDLAGAIDRVRIKVCFTYPDAGGSCGDSTDYGS